MPDGRRSLTDRLFAVGVIVKGVDGAIEVVVGLALLLVPTQIGEVLDGIVGTAHANPSVTNDRIATLVGHASAQLASGGTGFLIAFLIAHGAIKLALVYCLLRHIVRAYPVALAVLTAFLVYQVVAFAMSPSVPLAAFAVLDVVIIVLVGREYRELRGATRPA